MNKGTPRAMNDRIFSATFYEPVDGDSVESRLIIDISLQKVFYLFESTVFKCFTSKKKTLSYLPKEKGIINFNQTSTLCSNPTISSLASIYYRFISKK